MHSVSDRFLAALRGPHAIASTATHTDPTTAIATDLPIESGQVVVDVTAAIRRTLTLAVPATQDLFDVLSAPGGEIAVSQTLRYVDGSTETVPLGVFVVDAEQMSYANDGTIALTCPDRWLTVQRNKMGARRTSTPGDDVWQQIQALMQGAWPNAGFPFPGWSLLDESATATVPSSTIWLDGDRAKAITDLVDAHGLEVYFDADGLAVLRKIPVVTNTSPVVWTVDASASGVMIGADRTRDLSRTANAVIAYTGATDVAFTLAEARNDNPDDPLSTLGPLGYVPYYYTSSALRTHAQALAAAQVKLRQQLGVAVQVNLEAVGNPALDARDVIEVVYPRIDPNTTKSAERHVIDSVTVPLTPDGVQQVQTRSTRPDDA